MGLLSLFRKPPKSPVLVSQVQNLSREYPEDTITPQRYRQILHDADIGLVSAFMEILDAAAADAKVASVLRTRKLAVAGADWYVEPGDESALGKQIAEETEDFLRRLPDFTQFKFDLSDAHYRGFATMRLGWYVEGNRQLVAVQDPIESRFFRFENAVEPRIMTDGNYEGVPLPREYLFHVVRDKPGPITRGGTGRSIGKLWLYKGYNLVDLASYLEKFGAPHIQLTVPGHFTEGSPELERAKDAARALAVDRIGIVPAGCVIQLLESIKQTSTVNDTHLAFQRFCDDGIAQAELGHELSSSGSDVPGLGQGAEAAQAGELRQDIKQYDACGLVNVLHAQLIWPRTARQYGPTAPRPRLVIDVDAPENQVEKATAQKLRAETLAILKAAGLDLSVEQIRREFDLEKPAGAGDTLVAATPAPTAPSDEDEDADKPVG